MDEEENELDHSTIGLDDPMIHLDDNDDVVLYILYVDMDNYFNYSEGLDKHYDIDESYFELDEVQDQSNMNM